MGLSLVLGIPLVIVTHIIWDFHRAHDKPARQVQARTDLKMLSNATETFRIDVGRYPITSEGRSVLVEEQPHLKRWQGPYLKEDLPMDPWGNPYIYRQRGTDGFEISSLGSDGQPGGEDLAQDLAEEG